MDKQPVNLSPWVDKNVSLSLIVKVSKAAATAACGAGHSRLPHMQEEHPFVGENHHEGILARGHTGGAESCRQGLRA